MTTGGEGVIGPEIVGESVGPHPVYPVWVLLAIALLGCFVGLLIAAPSAVLARLAVERAAARCRASAWYLKGSPSGQEQRDGGPDGPARDRAEPRSTGTERWRSGRRAILGS